jgi:drug/metabolite transporter (DMT)-like permease
VNRRAHVSLLVVVVVWAGSFSVIKKLLDDGVSASDIAILRYAIAAPGFAYILWRARGLPGLTRADAVRVGLAGLLFVVG